jgi:hypothetical protein
MIEVALSEFQFEPDLLNKIRVAFKMFDGSKTACYLLLENKIAWRLSLVTLRRRPSVDKICLIC